MRPWLKRALLGCGAAVLVAALALGAFLVTGRGRRVLEAVSTVLSTSEPDALATGDDVLAYLERHRDRCSLAVWDVGDEDGGVYFDADTRRPLASTVKVLPLALYGERLDTGAWDAGEPVQPADVERYYLPHTDGEAHPNALAALDGGLTLDGVAWAMIRYSDNAAADWLLHRLGREAVDEGAGRLLGPGQGPFHPLSGTLLVAQRDGGAGDDLSRTPGRSRRSSATTRACAPSCRRARGTRDPACRSPRSSSWPGASTTRPRRAPSPG